MLVRRSSNLRLYALTRSCCGSYCVNDASRARELVLERTHTSVIHQTSLVIEQVLRGMEADGMWPEGVSWERVGRYRVRTRKRKLVQESVEEKG